MDISVQAFIKQLAPIYPELVVISFALAALVLDLLIGRKNKSCIGWFCLAGIVVAAVLTLGLTGVRETFFGATFVLDPFSQFFKLVFFLSCGLGILISFKYLDIEDMQRGEYYALMLFATSGMMIMASAA